MDRRSRRRQDSAEIFNKDGSTCVPVDYDFTNNVHPATGEQSSSGTRQSTAAFTYTVNGKPEGVDATGGRALPFLVVRNSPGSSTSAAIPNNERVAVAASAAYSRRRTVLLPAAYGGGPRLRRHSTPTDVPGDLLMPAVPFPINIGSVGTDEGDVRRLARHEPVHGDGSTGAPATREPTPRPYGGRDRDEQSAADRPESEAR